MSLKNVPEVVDLTIDENDVEHVADRAAKRQKVLPGAVSTPQLSNCPSTQPDDDDELVIIGESGLVATRDLPHSRPDCSGHKFVDGASASNAAYCTQCYCFVCDVKASQCLHWGSGQHEPDHANARPTGYWMRLRQAHREANRQTAPVAAAGAGRDPTGTQHRPSAPLQPASQSQYPQSQPELPALSHLLHPAQPQLPAQLVPAPARLLTQAHTPAPPRRAAPPQLPVQPQPPQAPAHQLPPAAQQGAPSQQARPTQQPLSGVGNECLQQLVHLAQHSPQCVQQVLLGYVQRTCPQQLPAQQTVPAQQASVTQQALSAEGQGCLHQLLHLTQHEPQTAQQALDTLAGLSHMQRLLAAQPPQPAHQPSASQQRPPSEGQECLPQVPYMAEHEPERARQLLTEHVLLEQDVPSAGQQQSRQPVQRSIPSQPQGQQLPDAARQLPTHQQGPRREAAAPQGTSAQQGTSAPQGTSAQQAPPAQPPLSAVGGDCLQRLLHLMQRSPKCFQQILNTYAQWACPKQLLAQQPLSVRQAHLSKQPLSAEGQGCLMHLLYLTQHEPLSARQVLVSLAGLPRTQPCVPSQGAQQPQQPTPAQQPSASQQRPPSEEQGCLPQLLRMAEHEPERARQLLTEYARLKQALQSAQQQQSLQPQQPSMLSQPQGQRLSSTAHGPPPQQQPSLQQQLLLQLRQFVQPQQPVSQPPSACAQAPSQQTMATAPPGGEPTQRPPLQSQGSNPQAQPLRQQTTHLPQQLLSQPMQHAVSSAAQGWVAQQQLPAAQQAAPHATVSTWDAAHGPPDQALRVRQASEQRAPPLPGVQPSQTLTPVVGWQQAQLEVVGSRQAALLLLRFLDPSQQTPPAQPAPQPLQPATRQNQQHSGQLSSACRTPAPVCAATGSGKGKRMQHSACGTGQPQRHLDFRTPNVAGVILPGQAQAPTPRPFADGVQIGRRVYRYACG